MNVIFQELDGWAQLVETTLQFLNNLAVAAQPKLTSSARQELADRREQHLRKVQQILYPWRSNEEADGRPWTAVLTDRWATAFGGKPSDPEMQARIAATAARMERQSHGSRPRPRKPRRR